MLSDRSCSAEVMKRLTPSTCQDPSGCSTARARPAPTSEPASGSVSTMVEAHRFATIQRAHFCWSGVPSRYSRWAHDMPDAYMCTAGFAPRIISSAAQRSEAGTTVPSSSSGSCIRHHSASMYALNDFLNDSGSVAVCVCGSKTGGLRSESSSDSATGPDASRSTSARIPRAVSSSTSANGPCPSRSPTPRTSNRVNSVSRRLLLK